MSNLYDLSTIRLVRGQGAYSRQSDFLDYLKGSHRIALLAIVANPLATKIGELVHRIFGSRREMTESDIVHLQEYLIKSDHRAFCEKIVGDSEAVKRVWMKIARYKIDLPNSYSGKSSPLLIAKCACGAVDGLLGYALAPKIDLNQPALRS